MQLSENQMHSKWVKLYNDVYQENRGKQKAVVLHN